MFGQTTDINKYIDYLERIIEIIAKLIEALMGGSKTTTTVAVATTVAPDAAE